MPHEFPTPASALAEATADLERIRARMFETQRDFITCLSASREIIAESWVIMAEADRLLARTGA
jgi:hypothetical protein